MSTNITTAASQYAFRPKDERYPSYAAFIAAAQHNREHSRERTHNMRDLEAIVRPNQGASMTDLRTEPGSGRVLLANRATGNAATLTHWSFGQLCSSVGAPAGDLRTIPPALAADRLNWGLKDAAHTEGKRLNLLLKANGGEPIVRAATSDTYGRLWDADLHSVASRYFGDGIRSSQGEWQSPPTWEGGLEGDRGGQYYGDRDSFVLRIDGGSIVGDPRGFGGGGNGRLNRGIMIRNSEVGACSITMDCVLFDFICGNHILWGAVIDRTFRRRHVGNNLDQKAINEILTIARRFNARSASQDAAIIKTLTEREIAQTKEAVVDELRKLGYSKQDAQEAYATCEANEPGLNPRSFWGLAAGTTRMSQESGYQDDRLALDQLAAAVLKRGAALVTV